MVLISHRLYGTMQLAEAPGSGPLLLPRHSYAGARPSRSQLIILLVEEGRGSPVSCRAQGTAASDSLWTDSSSSLVGGRVFPPHHPPHPEVGVCWDCRFLGYWWPGKCLTTQT